VITYEYLAGLIDGDGCIHFDLTKGNLYVVIKINMTHFGVIDALHKQFGGAFYTRAATNKNRASFVWGVKNNPAIPILVSIYPYLIVKKEQAKLAIQFYSLNEAANPEIFTYFKEQMHILNKKGVQ
jgi:hypothetical protein